MKKEDDILLALGEISYLSVSWEIWKCYEKKLGEGKTVNSAEKSKVVFN